MTFNTNNPIQQRADETIQSRFALYFTNGSAMLLAALAAALFLGNIAAVNLIQPDDPLFAIPMNIFFWILGAVSLGLMLVILFARQLHFKLLLILWFATNVIIYRVSLLSQGVETLQGYLDCLARAFNLSDSLIGALLNLLFLYLFAGSAALFLCNCLAKKKESHLKATLKISCILCGGHIAFPVDALGQKVSCPHCTKTITLLNPV